MATSKIEERLSKQDIDLRNQVYTSALGGLLANEHFKDMSNDELIQKAYEISLESVVFLNKKSQGPLRGFLSNLLPK